MYFKLCRVFNNYLIGCSVYLRRIGWRDWGSARMMTSSPRDEINGRLLKHQHLYKYLYKTKIRVKQLLMKTDSSHMWGERFICGVKDIDIKIPLSRNVKPKVYFNVIYISFHPTLSTENESLLYSTLLVLSFKSQVFLISHNHTIAILGRHITDDKGRLKRRILKHGQNASQGVSQVTPWGWEWAVIV